MKRFNSSDSLGALISICPPKVFLTETRRNNNIDGYQHVNTEENKCYYNKEIEAMLDSTEQEEYNGEKIIGIAKKKRLRFDQVKSLERDFEIENKLEPERKVQLAKELDLQPRQVAIWFQNRRARWKTRQLEKDYSALKANYDSLNLNFENLQQQNQALNQKLKMLKAKVGSETRTSDQSVKEEFPISGFESNNNLDNKRKGSEFNETDQGLQLYENLKLEDGSFSNEVIKEERILGFNGSSSSSSSNSLMNWFELSKSETSIPVKMCSQTQFVKMELEQSLFRTEEFCNFFSVDQAPTLHWYNFPYQ